MVYERAYLLQTGSCEKEALGLNRFYWCRVFPLLINDDDDDDFRLI